VTYTVYFSTYLLEFSAVIKLYAVFLKMAYKSGWNISEN